MSSSDPVHAPESTVLPLYPVAREASEPLHGLYLRLPLRHEVTDDGMLIYSNYITSIDGRISSPHHDDFQVPPSIANPRDWYLFQELAAQSDVVIVSGRYIRQLADGSAQAPPPIERAPIYDALHQWRRDQGLAPQPAIAVVSQSLDFPIEILKTLLLQRNVCIYTSHRADEFRVDMLLAAGISVKRAGESTVDGMALRSQLVQAGFKMGYMAAGPQLHRTLLVAGVLDRLFVTQHHSLLGGDNFHTMLVGDLLDAIPMQLETLYYDVGNGSDDGGQMFYQFRCGYKP